MSSSLEEKPETDANISSPKSDLSLGTSEKPATPQEIMNTIENGDFAIPEPPKTWRFWLVFVALCFTSLSTSLDATIITTALPTVVKSIGGEDQYVWIGDSFLLASTVVQPLVGQLADIFGRRWPMLISLGLFMLGSGIAGGANGVAMLIGGRIVQGLGAGGIFVLLDIITCDMVPIRERGKFLGLVLSTGAIGSTVGPTIGGAIAEWNWRWVFYISLPTAGIATIFMAFFLQVNAAQAPAGTSALSKVDYLGTLIFIPSMTSMLLGLIMGGTSHPWSSWNVIVPLVLGFVGWGVFHLYEMSSFCKNPAVPSRLFKHRTSAIGFVLAFESGLFLMWTVIFLPIYFQGVRQTSPLTSGVDMLPLSVFTVPSGIVAGAMMSIFGRFKPLQWAGFAITAIAMGLLSILGADSHKAAWVCFQIITAAGTGLLLTTVLPAIQASLPEVDQAKSTALFSFMRSFGFVWGITIPSVIFNTQFDNHLGQIDDPQTRLVLSNGGAYGLVGGGYLKTLSAVVQAQVVLVYTKALKVVWEVAIGFALLGFLLVFLEKHIDLRKELKTEYGLKDEKSKIDDAESSAFGNSTTIN